MDTAKAVKKKMEKNDLKGLKERVIKLEGALQQLTKNMVTSLASAAKADQELHGNQEALARSHDGLADRMFGFIDLLRTLSPEYAAFLSDENLVDATNAWIRRRAEQEEKRAEEEKRLELEAGLAEEPGEAPPDEDVPDGATVFGG